MNAGARFLLDARKWLRVALCNVLLPSVNLGGDALIDATLKTIVLSLSIGIFGSISLVQAQTAKNKYSCINKEGIYRTVADTERGRIELIKWKSKIWGSRWTPEERCNEVTRRFQEFSSEGTLRYVAIGKMNDYNVICVADKRVSGYECRKNGLLITLQSNDNPIRVMNELFDINNRVRGGGMERGEAIDIEDFLENAPLMESGTLPRSIPGTPSPPTSEGNGGFPVPDLLR